MRVGNAHQAVDVASETAHVHGDHRLDVRRELGFQVCRIHVQVLVDLDDDRDPPREDDRAGRGGKRERRTCDAVAPLDAQAEEGECDGRRAA